MVVKTDLRRYKSALLRLLSERSLYEFVRQYWRSVDPAPFIDGWHIRAMCEHLEAVRRGEIRRLLILVPPRTSKSSIVSVMLPAWWWTHDPGHSFISASHALSLSIRDNLRCRRVVQSDLYTSRYGGRWKLTGDQNAKGRFENSAGGYRLATSVESALTGEGADTIIIDDPLNVVDADSAVARERMLRWYDESLSTRLNDPATGSFIAVMQRVHHADFAGHVIERGGWETLCLPMRYDAEHPELSAADERTDEGDLLWPERFPDGVVSEMERVLGSYASAGQLQQRPVPRDSGWFKPEWWQVVDAVPEGGVVGRGWDFAAVDTGDYTVGVRVRRTPDGVFYIEDIVRLRGSDLDAQRALLNTASADGTGVLIDYPQDPGSAGLSHARYLSRLLVGYDCRFSPEPGKTSARTQAVAAQAEAGNIRLLRGAWNRDFIDEAAAFPRGRHDDQIDALSRIFHRLAGRRRLSFGAPVAIDREI